MTTTKTSTDTIAAKTTNGDIREHFERWARWRCGARYYRSTSGGGSSVVGKLMSGRGTRVCPTCRGAKRMPGHLVGSVLDFINAPCPQCDGDGRVAGDLGVSRREREIDCVFCRRFDELSGRYVSTGELPGGGTCHKCRGGKRLVVDLKVHPATIKGTRHFDAGADVDPISRLIDSTVMGWLQHNDTYWLARVVFEEYTRNGTQEMKAAKMGVSRGWYMRNLVVAHRRMAEAIKYAKF